MSKDTLFSTDGETRPFEFSESVARVFPDMLKRSIPGYAQSIDAIAALARRHVKPQTHCYDLGCSLGAATLAMRHNIAVAGCRIVAVDNAPAMVSRCREILAADDCDVPVEVLEADLRDVPVEKASMVTLNYPLQFLPPEERPGVLSDIANGLVDDGVLVLSEKVTHEDSEFDQLLIDLHHDFKRQNAYSEMEIARKRAAIENVLIPDTVAEHQARLREAGFKRVGVWLRWFNFVSLVAIR